MLTGGALALFVATAFAHTSDAADLTAANAALLEKYFADVKFVEHWDVDDLVGLAQQMRTPPTAQSND